MPRILWETEALEDFLELSRQDRRQAARVLQALRAFGRYERGDVKALKGRGSQMRLRVGDWRILVRRDEARDDSVLVMRILNRRDAYN